MSQTQQSKPPSLLKWVGIPVILAIIFMGILYIAMENEPDYMPAQQKKAQGIDVHAKHANASAEEHAQHNAAEHAEALSHEADNANHANTHSGH